MSRYVCSAGTFPMLALMMPSPAPGIDASCCGVVPFGSTMIVAPGWPLSARAAGACRAATPTTIETMSEAASRTYAKFTFFKVDPAWQRRDEQERAEDKREFLAACEDFAADRSLRAYSTVGTRGDTDLLLLSQSPVLEDIHTFHVVLAQSGLARWASIPHSYLAMTKRSPYSDSEARPEICTSSRKYLIVYPLDKKREWYRLDMAQRTRLMAPHIPVGPPHPG